MRVLYFVLVLCMICGGLNAQYEGLPITRQIQKSQIKLGPTFLIQDPFVFALAGKGKRSFLKARVVLELGNLGLEDEVSAKIGLIKDTIVRIMSSKTLKEVSTPRGRDKLKEEILQEINSYMVGGEIKNVFFSEFVIQ